MSDSSTSQTVSLICSHLQSPAPDLPAHFPDVEIPRFLYGDTCFAQATPTALLAVGWSSDRLGHRLTYQSAPINAWSLHPPDSEASHLLGLIDRTLNTRSTSSTRREA